MLTAWSSPRVASASRLRSVSSQDEASSFPEGAEDRCPARSLPLDQTQGWAGPRRECSAGHRGAGGAEGGGGGGPSPGAWWWRPRLRGSGRQGPQVSLTRASEVRKACDDFCCKVLTPRPTSWLLGQPLPPEAKTSQLPFASPGRLQPSPQPPRVTGGRGRACLSVRCEWWESSPPTVSVEIRRNRVCLGALLKCSPQASFVLVLCPALRPLFSSPVLFQAIACYSV